jgi:uncharacterized protein YcfJ
MRVFVITCVLMVAAVGAVSAQEPGAQASWAPEIGGEIRVTARDGVKTRGRFRSLDADRVRLLVADQETEIARDDITRIERRGDSIKNGFIIGAVIGILPAALASTQFEGGGDAVAVGIVAGMGIYGLIGAGIDAAHKGWTTVYKAESQAKSARRELVWIGPAANGMRIGYTRRF